MTIPLHTDALSLFNRIGKIGGAFVEMDTLRRTTLQDRVDDIAVGYDTADEELSEGLYPLLATVQESQTAYLESLRTLAENTVVTMANTSVPLVPKDLTTALELLAFEMSRDNETVSYDTLVTLTNAAGGSNVGSGKVSATVFANKVIPGNEFGAYDEVITFTCTNDRFSGATAGQETFSVIGEPAVDDRLSHLWPGGSGLNATVTVVDPQSDNAGGNLLTNSDYEDFTSNIPDNWALITGTAGTDFLKDTTVPYTGTACLKLVGDGATLLKWRQRLGNETGTLGEVEVHKMYALVGRIRGGDSLAAGVLTADVVNSAGTSVSVNPGSLTLSSFVTTAWQQFIIVFRTSSTLPDEVYFQLKTATALANTKILYLDNLALVDVSDHLYAGGPSALVLRGDVDFVLDDTLTLTVTNSDPGEMQQLFDRLFDMKAKGLLLPATTSGAATVSDSLVA